MRNPNGYGGVVKLSGKRRKPYMARVTNGFKYDTEKDKFVQVYETIGYGKTRKEALSILAQYNSGINIEKPTPIQDLPTFADVYALWYERKFNPNKKKALSKSSEYIYAAAYNKFKVIHNKKMVNLTIDDIQKCFDDNGKEYKKSSIDHMKVLLHQLYLYCIPRKIASADLSVGIEMSWKDSEGIHKPFAKSEVDYLWQNESLHDVDKVLMMIYSGVRIIEFVEIENRNVYLDKGYFICGAKTEAGKDRIVPIHSKVKKFFERYYNPNTKYLIPTSDDWEKLDYYFRQYVFIPLMRELGLDHLPHDTRHTFASMMDRAEANKVCTKKIMGHSIQDITDGTYVHKELEDLKKEIEKI